MRLHLTLAVLLPGCLAAGWFELTRALAGHEVAWAYAFEWPLYAVLGTYVWWRLVHVAPSDERGVTHPAPAAVTDPKTSVDPGLEAWQRYLDRLHERDPPGRPPWQR